MVLFYTFTFPHSEQVFTIAGQGFKCIIVFNCMIFCVCVNKAAVFGTFHLQKHRLFEVFYLTHLWFISVLPKYVYLPVTKSCQQLRVKLSHLLHLLSVIYLWNLFGLQDPLQRQRT